MPKKKPGPKPSELARVVTALREKKRWSQNELSRRAALSPAAVSRFLTGERRPRLEHLLAMAEALEVSPEQLVAGTEAEAVIARWGCGAQNESPALRGDRGDRGGACEASKTEIEVLQKKIEAQAAEHAHRVAELQKGRDRALRLANKYYIAWETLRASIAQTCEEAGQNKHRTIDVEMLATLHDNAKV